jgi:hypothetical protein
MVGKFGRYKPTRADHEIMQHQDTRYPYTESAMKSPRLERAFDKSVQCIIGKHDECTDPNCTCQHHDNRKVNL